VSLLLGAIHSDELGTLAISAFCLSTSSANCLACIIDCHDV